MKYLCAFVMCVGLVVCLQGQAIAQEAQLLGTLTKVNNSVTKVMQNAGCNQNWLSQVVADSQINPATLRRLPVGQKVLFRDGSCKGVPSAQVTGLSRMVVRLDLDSKQAQNLHAEIAALRTSAAGMTTRYATTVEENNRLKGQIADLGRQLGEEKGKVAALAESKQGISTTTLVSVALISLALGIALMYGGFRWSRRNTADYQLVHPVKYADQWYDFPFAGVSETSPGSGVFVVKRRCPKCSERNLFGRDDANLLKHLREKHPQERVIVEVDPSFHTGARASA